MKAVVQDKYGPPEILELREVERPAVAAGDVLVQVRAASVNPQDWHLLRASPFIIRATGNGLRAPKRPIRGTDAAGRVEAVGENVTRLRPGDEVFGWCEGAFAEYVCADESHFVPRARDVSRFEEAAAHTDSGRDRAARHCATRSTRTGRASDVLDQRSGSGGVGTVRGTDREGDWRGGHRGSAAGERGRCVTLARRRSTSSTTRERTSREPDPAYDLIIDDAGNRSLRGARDAFWRRTGRW